MTDDHQPVVFTQSPQHRRIWKESGKNLPPPHTHKKELPSQLQSQLAKSRRNQTEPKCLVTKVQFASFVESSSLRQIHTHKRTGRDRIAVQLISPDYSAILGGFLKLLCSPCFLYLHFCSFFFFLCVCVCFIFLQIKMEREREQSIRGSDLDNQLE